MIYCENKIAYRTLDFLGYPKYRVGDDGSIWSFKNHVWKKLKGIGFNLSQKKRFYLKVKLNNKQVAIHKIVLLAFTGPSKNGEIVRHLNDKWTDNRLINLEYGTAKDNQNDAIKNGKWKLELLKRGISHHMTSLTEQEVKNIKIDFLTMKNCDIAKKYKVKNKVINDIKIGRTWKHI